jgi:hypothetical protein
MNDGIIGITVTLCALGVLVPLLLTHATHRMQQIEDAWRKLAERHRLRFQPGRKLQVMGSLAGRAFSLASEGSGNKATFTMELELHGPLPQGLQLKGIGKPKDAHEAAGAPVISVHERSGRIDINGAVRVGARHPGELTDYLDLARQRAALRLIDVAGKLQSRTLSVPFTSHPDDLEGLDHALQELAAVAPVLEQNR